MSECEKHELDNCSLCKHGLPAKKPKRPYSHGDRMASHWKSSEEMYESEARSHTQTPCSNCGFKIIRGCAIVRNDQNSWVHKECPTTEVVSASTPSPRFRKGAGVAAQFEGFCYGCEEEILIGDIITQDDNEFWVHKECA